MADCTWKDRAIRHIADEARQHPELNRDALRSHCSRAYLFGARYGWPYKAWLAAMHERFGDPRAAAGAEKAGQLSLL